MEEKKAEILFEYLKGEEVKPLPWPFEKITLAQIITLSKRISVSFPGGGNTYELKVNGVGVKKGEYKDNDQTMVLSYIKLIGYCLNDLVKNDQVKRGINVHDYVIKTMHDMEDVIVKNSRYGKRTFPVNIHDCLEWGYKDFNDSKVRLVLFQVIKLLNYRLGYGLSNDGMKVVPTKPIEEDKIRNLVYNSQSILMVTDSDVALRIGNQTKTAVSDSIGFDEWLGEFFKPYKPEKLEKKYSTKITDKK